MTQTVGALSSAVGKLEIGTNGTVWSDISGSVMSLDPPSQARMSGETYTLDGDVAIITGGKREPLELAFSIVYTEVSDEAWDKAQAIFEEIGGEDIYVQWSPDEGGVGDWLFTSDKGVLTSLKYPGFDASSGEPKLLGFTVKVPQVTQTVISS